MCVSKIKPGAKTSLCLYVKMGRTGERGRVEPHTCSEKDFKGSLAEALEEGKPLSPPSAVL